LNQLKAKVIHIKSVDNLNYLTFSLNKHLIHMLSLELEPNIKIGKVVHLAVKSTHISIAKELNGLLSLENRLKAKVISIDNGDILSSVCLDIEGFIVESIISLESIKTLNLQIEDKVLVLINAFDVSIVNKN